MNDFKKWVIETGNSAGGFHALTGLPLGPEDFRKTLQPRRDRNDVYFKFAFGLSFLLGLSTIAGAFFHAEGWATGALGLSSAGAVAASMNAWREKDQFETMIDLAANLDEAAMRQVLATLLKKYGG